MLAQARANPTKAFFVRMLTRDISLDDCILDLVDNSIDGAWDVSGDTPEDLLVSDSLSRFFIEIDISTSGFRIRDNCGGITLNDAVNCAFTFGRLQREELEEFSVGVYGIGMKRAVFKLGNSVLIQSTYSENGKLSAFQVPIVVNEWMSDEDSSWDFNIEESDALAEPGVSITVTDLSEETANRFEDPAFINAFRKVLARYYMLPLMRGLKIRLNGDEVIGRRIELAWSEDFEPMRERYVDEGVAVQILAGMLAAPPDDTSPEVGRADEISGWYVMCNGRVVLAADRSITTGWGIDGIPRWHTQFLGFGGLVLFSASDAAKLPMTTTKRSVDTSSAVYRRALVRMTRPARAWADYTNARKADLEAAHRREASVSTIDVAQVAEKPFVVLPSIKKSPLRDRTANVNYAVPLKRMKALAAALGNPSMTYRDVGISSFDYAFEELVDEDE